jgi:hypothetical protein
MAVLSVLLLAGPLAFSARTAEISCPNVIKRGSDWSTISAPAFTKGGPELVDYKVHPLLPTMILVTNGLQVMFTENGGCSWKPYLALDELPLTEVRASSLNSRITHIEISEHPNAANSIYLVVEESVVPRAGDQSPPVNAVRPHIIRSSGGQDHQFTSTEHGLPLVTGGVLGIHAAPSDPDVVYLHVRREPTSIDDDIYASTDRGLSFTKRNTDQGTASQDMGVDPLNAEDLWTWGATGLWRSVDGGRTRSHFNQVGTPTPLVDIFHAPGSPARVMAYEAETGTFSVTKDGGATWERIQGPPGAARSLTHGNNPDDVIMAQHLRVDRFKPPSFWIHLEPGYKQPDLSQLSADRTPTPSVFGMTPTTIERYTGFNNTVELPSFVDVDPAEIVDDTALEPKTTTLKLKAGDSQKIDYSFALPAHPKPVDVFFLVDTTDSMDGAISGLRKGMQDIVNSLAASKLDVQFGVGEIKDYPIPGFGDPTAGDFPYRLDRKIGPADESLAEALEELEASGGGRGDYRESQLTGLYQAATGEGEPGCVVEPGATSPPCVVPGQGADFREDALKIIINITDYSFHDEAAHPSPPFNTVVDTLNTEEIEQVGLAVFGTQGIDQAIGDLTEMAEATETLAPGPVDCDADGSTDIAGGAPLVCELRDAETDGTLNLAPAIISTVRAIAQDVSVELVISKTRKGVVDIAPAMYPSVDITERNSLGFDLTFSCPRELAGTKHDLTLAAHVSGVPAATATARVVCKGVPVPPVPKEKPPVPPILAAPVFPPAPVIVPALAPAGPPPVPETISSTQSAAQAQGAVARQEQEQVQVAVAIAHFKNSEAYALSSYTERSRPSPLPMYLTAAVMSMAAAFVAVMRPRIRLGRAGNRH